MVMMSAECCAAASSRPVKPGTLGGAMPVLHVPAIIKDSKGISQTTPSFLGKIHSNKYQAEDSFLCNRGVSILGFKLHIIKGVITFHLKDKHYHWGQMGDWQPSRTSTDEILVHFFIL
ncbi:hypothetical protein SLEP1_g17108 [Rubroshorea leprosula]|uniref:Uncharacterized protein n=1 Tax=Rubroshorea leprosula TaxID=152421 RepID=A0AAV5IT84_9ROSI|nr:hypothetical protein SLEP1_g17108 [Rubroshorea leprosula]